jgi:hypothetical protein
MGVLVVDLEQTQATRTFSVNTSLWRSCGEGIYPRWAAKQPLFFQPHRVQ